MLNLLAYITNETETCPVTEALLQLNQIYRLLDKRQYRDLVSRMKVERSTASSEAVRASFVQPKVTLTKKPFIPFVTGIYSALFWFFDKKPDVGRRGTCVETGAASSAVGDSLSAE